MMGFVSSLSLQPKLEAFLCSQAEAVSPEVKSPPGKG
jgi:hypothetical protein